MEDNELVKWAADNILGQGTIPDDTDSDDDDEWLRMSLWIFKPCVDCNHLSLVESALIDSGHLIIMVAPVGKNKLFQWSVDGYMAMDRNKGRGLLKAAKKCYDDTGEI